MKRIFVFIVVGALLLTPLDALQVVFGVRTMGTDPWLTPLKFALVGGVLGILSYWLDPQPHPAKNKALFFHGISFAIAYISTLWWQEPTAILLALNCNLLLQGLVSAAIWRISFFEVLPFFILLMVGGPLAEWIDVTHGGFQYNGFPNTIPYWLPALWASGSFFTRALVGKERKEPKEYKWLGKFITFIAPAAQFIAKLVYALTPANIKRLGLIGSFKMAWRE